jgi:hypothetical protein
MVSPSEVLALEPAVALLPRLLRQRRQLVDDDPEMPRDPDH